MKVDEINRLCSRLSDQPLGAFQLLAWIITSLQKVWQPQCKQVSFCYQLTLRFKVHSSQGVRLLDALEGGTVPETFPTLRRVGA
jgi:hypothetical protein